MEKKDIIVIENFLSFDECDFIINKAKSIYLREVDIHNIGYNRKVSIGSIEDLDFVKIKLENALKDNIFINGMESHVDNIQFTEYKTGDYFDWHEDRNSSIYRVGVVSTVIQLNDDYIGGKFEIKDFNKELFPIDNKKGSLYMFNPNLLHRITMVESGSRHSLISWISLVKSNKTKQNLI
jgi:predicted 2-oxoglutarate/Fe(II)-dependent dioxygenase YbiX